MRGRSYTPSPPRGYGRRGRSPEPRGRYGRGDAPTSLLVRNLRHDCRLIPSFSGKILVKNKISYKVDYTLPNLLKCEDSPLQPAHCPLLTVLNEPRGFGFVQYVDPADAAEAKYQMDGQIFQGRELTVVFAEENRKKPTEMRARERGGRGRVYDRRRSPPLALPGILVPPLRTMGDLHLAAVITTLLLREDTRDIPHHVHGFGILPSDNQLFFGPIWSVSPRDKRYSRERSYSRSPARDHSPPYNGPRSHSGSPARERSPYGSRSRSQSPGRARSPVRARSASRSRSRSPYPAEYSKEGRRDRSPSQ
ncbi:Serine/arginine-rich SC35-like splicing factor SCL30A [Sesamum angolense]|uniref:Serine/arginine-rich SC35-like splicing factor SCL30A n=1 Tax=Sesamum angolense TaxID=2727404 RepID=A0AAE1XB90_9LAMI|nr:Serine/arginine-rich SC35-like splicing factor SCL30A [Sesamum angolense]